MAFSAIAINLLDDIVAHSFPLAAETLSPVCASSISKWVRIYSLMNIRLFPAVVRMRFQGRIRKGDHVSTETMCLAVTRLLLLLASVNVIFINREAGILAL